MHVALLNPCYWPEVRRGSERFIRELADQLVPRGHQVELITSHPGRPSRTVEDGMEVVRVWRPPEGRLRRRQYEDYLTHWPLSYAALKRDSPDLAHALYPTDALAALRWSEKTGRPTVFSYMGFPKRAYLVGKRKRLELTLRACRESAEVVALSHAAAEAFEHVLGIEARVIHPGVDTAFFTPEGERSPEPTIFCSAAVDQPQKRVPLLIEAFGLVRRERPDAKLLLNWSPAGDQALGTPPEGVEWARVDDREALRDAYRRAWACALPSRGEGFGLILVEAMACGTPAVGSRQGGVAETVDRDEVGRLFDGDDPEPLARAILEVLELAQDPKTIDACVARANDFSTITTADKYEALYREVLGRG